VQFVNLLFKEKFQPDFAAVKKRISEILGEELHSSPVEEGDSSFLIFHKTHEIEYKDKKKVPAQTAFMIPDNDKGPADYTDQIQQSWAFSEAAEVIAQAKFDFAITEFMAGTLDPDIRLKLFHAAIQAATEIFKPTALVFQHSCEVVDPQAYLSACSQPPELRPGTINVRFFNISNDEKSMIMDSRGLEEIGLPDLQCHYKGMNPNDISKIIYNTAVYIIQNGPVIETGQTITGRTEDEMWVCRYEDSLIKPTRALLDIDPGTTFAAGNREKQRSK
jgi:hypothetical protein